MLPTSPKSPVLLTTDHRLKMIFSLINAVSSVFVAVKTSSIATSAAEIAVSAKVVAQGAMFIAAEAQKIAQFLKIIMWCSGISTVCCIVCCVAVVYGAFIRIHCFISTELYSATSNMEFGKEN